jgi:hypothetical protein
MGDNQVFRRRVILGVSLPLRNVRNSWPHVAYRGQMLELTLARTQEANPGTVPVPLTERECSKP